MAVEEAKKQTEALKKVLARKYVHLKMDACTNKRIQEGDLTPGVFLKNNVFFKNGMCEKTFGADRSKLV